MILIRAVSTAALAAALLGVGLLAPVAAEPADIVTETVTDIVEGLPAASDGLASAADAAGRLSLPVETSIPFSLIGFALPDGAGLSFRTSVDGQQWTAWTTPHLHLEEGPDPGSAEARAEEATTGGKTLSEPVWVGEARHLQTRVTGAQPEAVDAHLVDSAGLHRSWSQAAIDAVAAAWSGSGAPAAAALEQPEVITRAEWGADESMRNGEPGEARAAHLAFVHHTAGSNDYTAVESPAVMRGIYAFHTRSRGWDDIGYNFLVDRYGQVFEGRSGGMDRAVIGAHAGGFNTGSIGVAIMGSFESASPPPAALDAVAGLLAWKFDIHHIDAGASITVESLGSSRYPEGAQVDLDAVSGHRDVSSTACPGGALYAQLPSIAGEALALADYMFIDPKADPYRVRVEDGEVLDTPVEFSARLRPAGSWTLEVTDPDGRFAHSDSGSGTVAASTWWPTGEPGTYTYEFRSSGRRTASGEITVTTDAMERIGATSDVSAGSVAISRAAFETGGSATHAVVTRDDVFADAMAGGPLAGSRGPLLLTDSERLSPSVRRELERVLPAGGTVYTLGGDDALSRAVRADLADTWRVVPVFGAERTATAARVAGIVLTRSGETTAMLARAHPDGLQPWADALAGGAYGAARGIPVLLTHPSQLSDATRAALEGLASTIVLGGDAAVSDEVVAELPSPRRVSGKDRTGTAVAVATELWGRTTAGEGDRFLVGAGYRPEAWTMALAASPLAAREDAPLLVTDSTSLSPSLEAYLTALDYDAGHEAGGWVLGPESSLATDVAVDVANLLQ